MPGSNFKLIVVGDKAVLVYKVNPEQRLQYQVGGQMVGLFGEFLSERIKGPDNWQQLMTFLCHDLHKVRVRTIYAFTDYALKFRSFWSSQAEDNITILHPSFCEEREAFGLTKTD